MKTNKHFAWLLGLMLALATTAFTGCSDNDDDNQGGSNTEQADSLTAMYDDLAMFQRSICRIDSAGQLVRYEVGVALHENEPQHLYIGVDNIEEAAKMFATWIAPDVKLGEITPNVAELTAQLTDTAGISQGTIYFRKGSGSSVAEVTASANTQLKYVDRITFLLKSAWPYNSETSLWHKGDIRRFKITGDATKYLSERDRELNFVLVREGECGVNPMWVAITKDGYDYDASWLSDFYRVGQSNYCPIRSKALAIYNSLKTDWDYFKGKFDEAGAGELNPTSWYWYNQHSTMFAIITELHYQYYIRLGDASIDSRGHHMNGPSRHFLLMIDWLKDGELPLGLSGTDGTVIKDGSFNDVSGSYNNLFDGLNDTRWCTNHQWWASQSNPLYWVEFEAETPITPSGYIFVTGDANRWPQTSWDSKPHNWKLYGKRERNNDWTLLDQRSGENLPSESYKEKKYNLNNVNGEYQYFRLEITDNQPWLCLAEFKFTL